MAVVGVLLAELGRRFQSRAEIHCLKGTIGFLFGAKCSDSAHSVLTSAPARDSSLLNAECFSSRFLAAKVFYQALVDVHDTPKYRISYKHKHRHTCLQRYRHAYIKARMEYKDRVKAARRHKKLTQLELSAAVGITQASVSDLERGKSVSSSYNARIAEVCGVSAVWLETGKGEMLVASGATDRAQADESNIGPMLQPHRAPKEYPLISWVSAGLRAESPDNFEPGDGEEMLWSTENAGEHGYWLRVRGKSMVSTTPPSFPEGTPILVKPEGFELISGKFYIFKHIDGEATFKQFTQDSGRGYMTPLNGEFKQVEMDDEWRVIGRVIDAKITGL